LIVGYKGGWWDRIVTRFVDVLDSVPGLLLAFAVIAVLGRGLTNAMIAVGLIFVKSYIRLTRALVLAEKETLYVEAAKVSGLTSWNIMFRQILPNVAGPLVVQTGIYMSRAVLLEATLSFLGLGLDITRASWGGMLSAATQFQYTQPLLPWPPGLAIAVTVLCFNLVGDGVRDAIGGEKEWVAPSKHRKDRAAVLKMDAYADSEDVVLSARNLAVRFPQANGQTLTIVDDVSLELAAGGTLGLIGESGCGKSMTGLALMGLVPIPGYIAEGSVRLRGRELTTLTNREMTKVRGKDIGMVFQDPLVALSPVHTVGQQITQAVRNHSELSRRAAWKRGTELLNLVHVPNAAQRMKDYPFQFSGGMAQRVVIAMAIASNPKVLIADEPTTALDVTIQREVLDLIADLKDRLGVAVLLVAHHFGVVADSCERTAVMYAGQIVEEGDIYRLLASPRHPYTSALLQAMPSAAGDVDRLATIEGRVPPPWEWPEGCRFHPRCAYAESACAASAQVLDDGVRCRRWRELSLPGAKVTTGTANV
jgi:peptide/nickel transport system permease protein